MKSWEYTDHWEGDKKVVTCIYDNVKTFRVFNEAEGKQLEKALNELQDDLQRFKWQYYRLRKEFQELVQKTKESE